MPRAASCLKERGQGAYINLRAVILVTPLIPAIGWDEWGDGNPEEQRQPSWYSRYISTGAVGCAFVKGVPC